ncbi:MAG: hypothetical protein R2697_03295 [Ilumatobacteraceae bacterium]
MPAGVVDGDLDTAVAAVFFHDVVYDPTANDNEATSASMARRALTDLGWPPGPNRPRRSDDRRPPNPTHAGDDLATCVMLAADLGVLAAEPSPYGDYVRNVRKEYRHLDDAAWTAGRSSFVRSMLDRSAIFPVPLRLNAWERRARANLTAELAAMGSLSDGGASDAREP